MSSVMLFPAELPELRRVSAGDAFLVGGPLGRNKLAADEVDTNGGKSVSFSNADS